MHLQVEPVADGETRCACTRCAILAARDGEPARKRGERAEGVQPPAEPLGAGPFALDEPGGPRGGVTPEPIDARASRRNAALRDMDHRLTQRVDVGDDVLVDRHGGFGGG